MELYLRKLPLHAFLVFLLSLAGIAHAQRPANLPGNYPSKPVRVIVGSAPGGGTDIISRLILASLGDNWKQNFIIDNQASEGGMVGLDIAVRSKPDGYTLLVAGNSTLVQAALVSRVSEYDVHKVLAPIALFSSQPYVLATSISVPANSVKELLAHIKAHPGQLNYASAGTGSAAHIGGEQLKYMAGLDMVHVPYKGIGPGIVDMIGGRIHLLFGSALSIMPHAKSGKVKMLAVGSLKRNPLIPDVPTIVESGLPGFEMVGWYGLLAPAGTPQPLLTALNQASVQVLATPQIVQKLAADGAEAPQYTPEQFRAIIVSEIDKIAKLMKETGLKLN